MAKRISLATFKTNIRNLGEFREEYISNAELTTWVNEAVYKFYAMMSAVDPLRYIKSEVINVVSGTNEYDLADDFFRTVGVAIEKDGLDGYFLLDSFRWDERYNVDYASTKEGTKYLIKGETQDNTRDGYHVVQLMPTPTYSANLLFDYVPAVQDLDSDNDTFDTINGLGFNWVCADVAVKCCAKEEQDPSIFAAMKQEAQGVLTAIGDMDTVSTKSSKTSNTLQSMWRAVRGRGKWERDLFADTELTEYINSSIASLWDFLIINDQNFLLSRDEITTSNGTKSYDLVSDFYRCVQVAMSDGGGTKDSYDVLDKYNWEEQYDTDGATAAQTRYDIRENKLYLLPTPTGANTVRVDYVPKPTSLSSPSDTFSVGNGYWVEWVILDAAIKCAAFAGTDPGIYLAQKKEVEGRIAASAKIDIAQTKTSSTSNTLRGLQRTIISRGPWPADAFANSELTEMINSSIVSLRDIVISSDPSHFMARDDISVSSGTREYDLPSDFYRMVGVSYIDPADSDGYKVMDVYNFEERYGADNSAVDETRYHVRNGKIQLLPVPSTSFEIRVEYIQKPTALADPSDSFELGNGFWGEWVILDCLVKCAAATGTDPSVYLTQKQEAEQRVVSSAKVDIAEDKTTSSSNSLRGIQRAIRGRGPWPKEIFSNTQLTEYINSSIATLKDLMSHHDNAYFLTRSDVTLVSGTKEYSLPSDFYKIMGAAVKDNNNPDGYAVLDRFDWDERYDYSFATNKWDLRYEVRNDKIAFHPTPTGADTVRVEYIPQHTALADPSDTFSVGNGYWVEWVLLDCCIKCSASAGTDPQIYMAQKGEIEAKIVQSSEIDIGKPKTVVDVRRRRRYRHNWRR